MQRRTRPTLRLAVLSGALALALTGPASLAASQAPIVLTFVKDCPVLTCEETDASPVDVDTVVTPVAYAGGVLHYTAVETISSGADEVTLHMTGILDFNLQPNLTKLSGIVAEGSWDGITLDGARMYATAIRLYDTTFGGTILIFPATAR